MFELWWAADQDLLRENAYYSLSNTGQGLQRVQSCPVVHAVMQSILRFVRHTTLTSTLSCQHSVTVSSRCFVFSLLAYYHSHHVIACDYIRYYTHRTQPLPAHKHIHVHVPDVVLTHNILTRTLQALTCPDILTLSILFLLLLQQSQNLGLGRAQCCPPRRPRRP